MKETITIKIDIDIKNYDSAQGAVILNKLLDILEGYNPAIDFKSSVDVYSS